MCERVAWRRKATEDGRRQMTAGSAQPKTRTPHKDLGKKKQWKNIKKKHMSPKVL